MYDGGAGDVGTLTAWSIDITYTPIVPFTGIWTPSTNLFLDAAATVPYTGTSVSTVYAKPPTSTSYSVTIANGSCVSPATTIPVTVNIPVTIGTSPANASVCTDKTVTFSVAATGTGLSYQWQVSTNGGTSYANVANGVNYAGATTTTLSVIAPPVAWNGYRYRCVVSGTAPCGPATSGAAIMTVNPLPTITLSAAPYTRLFPGLTTTISTAVSPVAGVTYTWFLNGTQVAGPGTASTYSVNVDGFGDYTVRVTDANGCTNTSGAISILDSVSSRLFIYPTPNNGQFQVRYYSLPGNALARYLYIYDSKGARIYVQQFQVGKPYGKMDVDITRFRSGTYWVELADANGKRIKIGRTIVP